MFFCARESKKRSYKRKQREKKCKKNEKGLEDLL